MTECFEGFWTLQESAKYFQESYNKVRRLLCLGFFPNAIKAGNGAHLLPISEVKMVSTLTQEEKARFETKIHDLISRVSVADLLNVSKDSFHRWAKRRKDFPDIANNGKLIYGKYMYSTGLILTWAVKNKIWYDKKVLVKIIETIRDEQTKESLKIYLGETYSYIASKSYNVDLPIDRKQ